MPSAVAELAPLLVGLEPEKRTQVLQIVQEYVFEGPIAPPHMLAQYEAIVPGMANRMMVLVEKQAEHRQAMEAKIVGAEENRAKAEIALIGAEVKRSGVGQWMAYTLAIGLTIAGTWLALHGQEGIAKIIFGGTLAGIAGLFIANRIFSDKRKDSGPNDEKKQDNSAESVQKPSKLNQPPQSDRKVGKRR